MSDWEAFHNIQAYFQKAEKISLYAHWAQQMLVYVSAVCGNFLTGMPGEEQIPVNVFPVWGI